jgi:hypothetical protein
MPNTEEVIVPGHPRWPEFISRLSRARICFGNTEQARRTLAGMADVDVEGSLRELARLGGACDCQIELDVAGARTSMRA